MNPSDYGLETTGYAGWGGADPYFKWTAHFGNKDFQCGTKYSSELGAQTAGTIWLKKYVAKGNRL